MDEQLDLSVIIVNWNCEQVIFNCLDSLVHTIRDCSYEIIIVDNNSQDGSIEKIISSYPQVRVIRNDFNNLFAGANNQGYAISKGKYIFVLNPDTVVTDHAVDGLVSILKDGKESAVTCTLLNKDGSVQYNMHRGFPSFIGLVCSFLYVKFKIGASSKIVNRYLLIKNAFDKDFYVEQAAGAAVMLSRKLILDIGGLFDSERFPLFYNDVDLSYRIKEKGVKILCKTDIEIYHLKNTSVKKLDFYVYGSNSFISLMKFFRKHKLYTDYLLAAIGIKIFFILLSGKSCFEYAFRKIDTKEWGRRNRIVRNILAESFR